MLLGSTQRRFSCIACAFDSSDLIPASWARFKLPRATASATTFISSFADRLAQLDHVAKEGVLAPIKLSLFFNPSSFLSATQQHAARKQGVSLETLHLRLDLDGQQHGHERDGFTLQGEFSPSFIYHLAFLLTRSCEISCFDPGMWLTRLLTGCFSILGITLYGATSSQGRLMPSDTTTFIEHALISWVQAKPDPTELMLPVYTTVDRDVILASPSFAHDGSGFVPAGAALVV